MSDWDLPKSGTSPVVDQRREQNLLATAWRLYKSDLVFRGFLDLLVVGCLVLAFAAHRASPTDKPRDPKWRQHQGGIPMSEILNGGSHSTKGDTQGLLPTLNVPSQIPDSATSALEIQRDLRCGLRPKECVDTTAIRQSGSPATQKLLAAVDAMKIADNTDALRIVSALDDSDPMTAYVKPSAADWVTQAGSAALHAALQSVMLLRKDSPSACCHSPP